MRLAILGASARAAACSALAAGHQVVAADLFADRDLAARCPATRIVDWPNGFAPWLAAQSVDGWLYTGGLENYPELVDQLDTLRPLLGNNGSVLRQLQSHATLATVLAQAGCCFPETRPTPPGQSDNTPWLIKTVHRGGGLGVTEWDNVEWRNQSLDPSRHFWQRRIAGRPISAAYLARAGQATLLGITQQLIGPPWHPTRPFQYAGSVGPFDVSPATRKALARAGTALASELELQGLFGIDFVVDADHQPWVVDVNPRYTASMEIVERLTGQNLVACHLAAWGNSPLGLIPLVPLSPPPRPAQHYIGKAYLFATEAAVVLPAFLATITQLATQGLAADLPTLQTRFAPGDPVLTLLATSQSPSAVEQQLSQQLARLQTLLHPPA